MTFLDPDLWKRLSPLLDVVLELDAPGRAAQVAALRSTDAALADELQSMLDESARAEAEGFLGGHALDRLAGT